MFITKYYLEENRELLISKTDIIRLCSVLNKAIYSEYPKLAEFNKYLSGIVNIFTKLGLPLIWTLPSGLEVNQSYRQFESFKISPFRYSKSTFTLIIFNETLDKSSQVRALMPNLIHSLDACSLALLVKLLRVDKGNVEGDSIYKTNINFYSVHDCYATTMNKMGSVIKYLKIVYTMIYTDNNYLRKFDKEIKNLIIKTLGEDCFYKDENEDTLKFKLSEIVKIEYPNVDLILLGNINRGSFKW